MSVGLLSPLKEPPQTASGFFTAGRYAPTHAVQGVKFRRWRGNKGKSARALPLSSRERGRGYNQLGCFNGSTPGMKTPFYKKSCALNSNGEHSKIQCRASTGALVDIPCHEQLRSILDVLPRVSTHILTDANGRPFRSDNFRHQWREATLAAGLDGLQFRDLRRTAMIRLAEAGCTDIEIAAISGHEIDQTRKILETYVPRTSAMASAAIAKLESHRPHRERAMNAQSGESGKQLTEKAGNTRAKKR